MNVKELKAAAVAKGIKGASRMNRAALLAALGMPAEENPPRRGRKPSADQEAQSDAKPARKTTKRVPSAAVLVRQAEATAARLERAAARMKAALDMINALRRQMKAAC